MDADSFLNEYESEDVVDDANFFSVADPHYNLVFSDDFGRPYGRATALLLRGVRADVIVLETKGEIILQAGPGWQNVVQGGRVRKTFARRLTLSGPWNITVNFSKKNGKLHCCRLHLRHRLHLHIVLVGSKKIHYYFHFGQS